MIPQQISTDEELEDILRQHTGSKHAIWDLRMLLPQHRRFAEPGNRYYRAYSRGKTTIVLFKSEAGLFLVDVVPKRLHGAWFDGIDYDMIKPMLPLFQDGGKLNVGWHSTLTMNLARPLREKEILEFLEAGWTEYVEYIQHANTQRIELKMK